MLRDYSGTAAVAVCIGATTAAAAHDTAHCFARVVTADAPSIAALASAVVRVACATGDAAEAAGAGAADESQP